MNFQDILSNTTEQQESQEDNGSAIFNQAGVTAITAGLGAITLRNAIRRAANANS